MRGLRLRGEGKTEKKQSVKEEPATSKPKEVDVSSLPPLEDHLPPLDEGRVELAAPQGWHPMSRRETYVAGFAPNGSSGSTPPRILVTSDPAPGNNPGFTAAEAEKFEAYIKPIIEQELKGRKDLREPPRILVIGDRPWVRYVLGRSFKRMPMDGQVLKTVANGRIYAIELQVSHQPNRIEHRDQAYAIAAGIRFPKVATAAGDDQGKESLGDLLGGSAEEEKSGEESGGGEEAGGGEEGKVDADGGKADGEG